ncbi:MAG: hypothetical protein IIC93_06585, partial [Chloroflexi bacterium]|nr:hypothetical protein [Chloroflexota bacterium]
MQIRVDMLSNRPHHTTHYALQGTDGCYESGDGHQGVARIWLHSRKAQPRWDVIEKIRELHLKGNRIIMFTARGTETGKDWRVVTELQLKLWEVPYDELIFGKPAADIYVD